MVGEAWRQKQDAMAEADHIPTPRKQGEQAENGAIL